jgi:hypothetical protein
MVTEETKQAVDVMAASTGIMSLAAWLPPVASLFTIIWLGIRIYESESMNQKQYRRLYIKSETSILFTNDVVLGNTSGQRSGR